MTVKPRYDRGLRDWQNTFPITKFRYIEVLFHILYCLLLPGQRLSSLNRSLYITDTSIRRTPPSNGHLELVPAFLCSLYLTLYKTDISLRLSES